MNVTHNLPQLGQYLQRYLQVTSRSIEEGCRSKAYDLALALYKTFLGVRNATSTQHRERIYEKARSLKFALSHISPLASQYALQLLGGNASAYGAVSLGQRNTLSISLLRIGKRGNRIRYRHHGTRGAQGSSLSPEQARLMGFHREDGMLTSRKAIDPNEHVLNRRALTVAFALKMRLAGTGSLGVAWLMAKWKNKSLWNEGTLEHLNPRAVVRIQGRATVGKMSVRLENMMPGAEKFPGAVDQAARIVMDDLDQYFARELAKAAKEAA